MSDTRHFDEELNALKSRLLVMGDLAEQRVRASVDALVSGDRDRIRQVIDGDRAIDELQIEIDNRCLRCSRFSSRWPSTFASSSPPPK